MRSPPEAGGFSSNSAPPFFVSSSETGSAEQWSHCLARGPVRLRILEDYLMANGLGSINL